MTSRSPCLELDCRRCCHDTAMTLTEADVARLRNRGHRDFWRCNDSGDLQLVNRGGCCVFLTDAGCAVYDDRPEGCRLYPLVLDLVSGRVERDDTCPAADRFGFGSDAAERLRLSVRTEARERDRRRLGRDPYDLDGGI